MPRDLVNRIAAAAQELLGEARVVLFGSVAAGLARAASDMDILVVSPNVPRAAFEQAKLKAAIEERAGLPPIHPVELHLATPRQAASHPIYREVLGGAGKSRPRARRDS